MTGITTHLLDIATGRPLSGVQVELYDVATDPPTLLNKTTTNPDGRTNAPMMPAASARTGQFELRFHVGEYFKSAEALVRRRTGALCDLRCRPALSCAHALRAAVLLDLSRQLKQLEA